MNHPSLFPPNNSRNNNNQEEEDDDDDDVVVQEIGVFLSTLEIPDDHNVAIATNTVTNSTNHRTYLMQYPGHWNHHDQRDDSMECPVSVRIKPRHNILEAEHDTNHHRSTGSSSSSSSNNNNNNTNEHDTSFTTNTRTYESQTIPMNTHLCLGKYVTRSCLNDNNDDADDSSPTTTTTTELHLIPLTHVTQMRPSFQHFRISTEMMEDTETDEPNAHTNHPTDTSNNNATTTIAYQRKESDRAYQVRQSSFAHYLASQESEAFTPLHVVAKMEDTPGMTTTKTTTTTTTNQSLFSSYHREQYRQSLNYLRPTTTNTATTTATIPSHPTALVPPTKNNDHSQQQRNTKRILTTILPILQASNGPVPFSILQLAVQNSRTADPSPTHTDHSNDGDDDNDTTSLWSILNTVAVLVRGNWYIHSKFMTILPHPSILSRDRKQQSAALKGPILSASSSNNNNHTAPVILVGSQANHQQQMYKVQQQRIRTFGLLLLHLYGKIDKARFLQANRQRSTAESDREGNFISTIILQQLARPVRAGYWVGRIIMDDDPTIIDDAATPDDVVARHDHYWQSMRQRFEKELQCYNNDTRTH